MAAKDAKADDKVKPSDTLVLISAQALKSLLKADDNLKGKIDELTGELREEIGNAVEKKHLHKKAYATLKAISRIKSNEELSNYWHTLLAYMDMAGVMARIDSVSELPLDGEEPEDEEETAGDKVTRPQFGAREPAKAH